MLGMSREHRRGLHNVYCLHWMPMQSWVYRTRRRRLHDLCRWKIQNLLRLKRLQQLRSGHVLGINWRIGYIDLPRVSRVLRLYLLWMHCCD